MQPSQVCNFSDDNTIYAFGEILDSVASNIKRDMKAALMMIFSPICLNLLLNLLIHFIETLVQKVKKALSSDLPFGRIFAVVHIGMGNYSILC